MRHIVSNTYAKTWFPFSSEVNAASRIHTVKRRNCIHRNSIVQVVFSGSPNENFTSDEDIHAVFYNRTSWWVDHPAISAFSLFKSSHAVFEVSHLRIIGSIQEACESNQ